MHTYEIFTAQSGPHTDLVKLVNRFKNADFQRPIPAIQQQAFDRIWKFFSARKRPLIIDAGCGTGMSTRRLALHHPHHDVVGIDKSAHRLSRANDQHQQENLLLVHGNLIDLWRLLAHARLPITHHYLLYPNPWPKIGQVKQRFHAHPVFKTMLGVAPYLEVRTNWRIYAEELCIALEVLGQKPQLSVKTDNSYISLFEKKYVVTKSEIFIVKNVLIENTSSALRKNF